MTSLAPDVAAPLLEAIGLSRSFGANEVLTDINLQFHAGRVTAIIGENGAGKSTLMKILSGHLAPSKGALRFDGAPLASRGPIDAERRGIVLVHQEILLAPHLSVAQNMFLGRELWRVIGLDNAAMNARASAAMRDLGAEVSVTTPVERLSVAQRQLAQIARALMAPHRVVIFDEPTASLTPIETAALFKRIRALKEQGVAVLYISHRLDEVSEIADFVAVLRDGRLVAAREASALKPVEMAHLMVGRDLQALYPKRSASPHRQSVLEVEQFDAPGFADNISFKLRGCEILGFAGLVGAGRTELFEALLGLRRGKGEIRAGREAFRFKSARAGMDVGIVYVTEDRKAKGLLLEETLATNLTLAALDEFTRWPFMMRRQEARKLDEAIDNFDIRADDPAMKAGQLSGGNQQKLLLAKMLMLNPAVLIIDEPTRGVDIGARQQIYHIIAELAKSGVSIILISSEMGELIGMCDRILVMREGAIVGELKGKAMREENIVVLATGVKEAMRA